jgi:choline/glycine/proline betaine transport protein
VRASWLDSVNPPVFLVSGALITVFVALGAWFPDAMDEVFGEVLRFIASRFGWFYILAVGFLLFFVLWLMLSRYAHVRLGDDDDQPEFTTGAWFAMLFSAGMGIGLIFYGVAEPMLHFADPVRGEGGTTEAAKAAMKLTFFHWGLHAWAIYGIVGLALAYFSFRRKLPLTIRSVFHPLLGERVHGPLGHLIDILAVFGTLFGLATSLGLGAMQINSGLSYLFGIERSTLVQVGLIGLITCAAAASLVTGLDRGIKRLSQLNMAFAALLLCFVFIAGPTLFLMRLFADNLGNYLQKIVESTFWAAPFEGLEWQTSWTLFYWGWWIAWAPFVGTFIARISRGRTVREFLMGVLLVPTLITFVWLTVFGGTALHLEMFGGGRIAAAVDANLDTAIFAMLERLPLATLSSGLTVVVVTLFFVTSSDSGSMVVDMITSGGHPTPPVWQRIFWASAEGVVASVLLLAGGLRALQAAAIATGLPFAVVLLVMCFSLVRALREEPLTLPPRARSPS